MTKETVEHYIARTDKRIEDLKEMYVTLGTRHHKSFMIEKLIQDNVKMLYMLQEQAQMDMSSFAS